MYVKDSKKVTLQGYIRTDIGSNITNITSYDSRIRGLVNAINSVLAGYPDLDNELLNDCKAAQDKLSKAVKLLTECSALTGSLNTDRWVDDDQY